MKTILITGGAGFIGSNFIPFFLKKHPEIHLVNVDLLTYAGNLENLEEVKNHPKYTFEKGDICDRAFMESIFIKYDIKGVIHFAAESHVDNSIKTPDNFIKTNVFGTFNLLEIARNYWMTAPHQYKKTHKNCRFHQISTDEVYGSLPETGMFTEKTPYAPNSPYSASKASADFLVRSYFHTYGMNVVTTCCSNNYGAKQHPEKLIPTVIRKALSGDDIPIYGDGKNSRDWLYVLDHCKAIELVYRKGKAGETYNIGGENEQNNMEMANLICELLDAIHPQKKSYKAQISLVEDRPGHDFRYAIDASKIMRELNWKVEENFETSLKKTVGSYFKKFIK